MGKSLGKRYDAWYAFWYLPMYVTYAKIVAHVRDYVQWFQGNCRTLSGWSYTFCFSWTLGLWSKSDQFTLFYVYYFGRWYSLNQLFFLILKESLPILLIVASFYITCPRCYKDIYTNTFFPCTARSWYYLPGENFYSLIIQSKLFEVYNLMVIFHFSTNRISFSVSSTLHLLFLQLPAVADTSFMAWTKFSRRGKQEPLTYIFTIQFYFIILSALSKG